jgi:hypothetical protein
MPNYGYEWDKMYPGGFVKQYATRHLPKELHERMTLLSTFFKMSVEMILIKAAEIGVASLETELKKIAEANGVKNNQS